MKERMIAIFICLIIFTTVIPIVGTSNIEIKDEESFEIKRISNTSEKGLTFKEFVRGRIDDLYVYGDFVHFNAKAVRSIGFASDGDGVWFWRNWFFRLSIAYIGFDFHGIMRPHYICGVFTGTI